MLDLTIGGGGGGGGKGGSENARPENNLFKNRERKIIYTEIKEREIRKQIAKKLENNTSDLMFV